MGQCWMVINLDREEKFDSWGKLGEWLFDTTPSTVIPYLDVLSAPSSITQGYDFVGSWAGDRIICIGDYSKDYPEDLLTEGEIASFRERFAACDTALFEIGDHFETCEFFCSSRIRFSKVHIWVLRNLTKLEYVRTDAFGVDANYIRGPYIDKPDFPGLGEVLVSRISWSTEPSAGMMYEGNITRGVWAGDRFDIRTIDSIETPCDGEHWKDVSEEVVQEAFEIWRSEYGQDWGVPGSPCSDEVLYDDCFL